ncbi:MAG: aldo/keto reductase, partial [Ruminiclostridium sp.]
KLDYVDIFYHHRPDPNTPLEETMDALVGIVRSGKALYVGISNYSPADTKKASEILTGMGVHCLIHQMRYSMFNRETESVLDVLEEQGMGSIAFSPLAQGLLTGKYANGIPGDSRAAGHSVFLTKDSITPEKIEKAQRLGELAEKRGQSLSQMALAWVLRRGRATSVILGASRLEQIKENIGALDCAMFTDEELTLVDDILK